MKLIEDTSNATNDRLQSEIKQLKSINEIKEKEIESLNTKLITLNDQNKELVNINQQFLESERKSFEITNNLNFQVEELRLTNQQNDLAREQLRDELALSSEQIIQLEEAIYTEKITNNELLENLKELEDKYELVVDETEGLKKGLYIPRRND